MMDTIISLGALGVSASIGAGVWYKLGKMESKINLIYNNINIVVDWKNGTKKKGDRKEWIGKS